MTAVTLTQPAWRRWLVLPALALGIGMVGIDVSIVSVANATIGRDLHASLGGLQWVTNAYLLALCSVLLTAGQLADRIGRKRIFIAGVAAFGLASAGCALAGSTAELIAFRAIQGVAGGALIPTSFALVRATFPPEEIDRALGVWAAASTSSIVAGPIIGGFLVEYVSWQSVFLINLPIGALAIASALWFATESRAHHAALGFDLPGIALAGTGLFVLVFALVKVQSHGWTSAYTLGIFTAAVFLLAAFVVRERSADEPMLPLGLFSSRALSAATVLTVVTYFTFYGLLFFWTLYLQRVLSDSPVTSGVQLMPLTFGFVGAVPLAGWLSLRFGPRASMLIGLLGIAAGSMLLTRVHIADGYGGVWPLFLLVGVSLGLAGIAGIQTMMSNAPIQFAGITGAVVATAYQLGGVLGIAVLGSVLESRASATLTHGLAAHGLPVGAAARLAAHATSGGAEPLTQLASHLSPRLTQYLASASPNAFLSGLHAAMWIGAGVSLAGCLLAPLVRNGDGEPGPTHLI